MKESYKTILTLVASALFLFYIGRPLADDYELWMERTHDPFLKAHMDSVGEYYVYEDNLLYTEIVLYDADDRPKRPYARGYLWKIRRVWK